MKCSRKSKLFILFYKESIKILCLYVRGVFVVFVTSDQWRKRSRVEEVSKIAWHHFWTAPMCNSLDHIDLIYVTNSCMSLWHCLVLRNLNVYYQKWTPGRSERNGHQMIDRSRELNFSIWICLLICRFGGTESQKLG